MYDMGVHVWHGRAWVTWECMYDMGMYDMCMYDMCMYDMCMYDMCMYDMCMYDMCMYDMGMYDIGMHEWHAQLTYQQKSALKLKLRLI
jgi:hypothetical protein